MSQTKHKTERFNKMHPDIEKNRRGNASRTAWAKKKKEKKNDKGVS